MASRAFRDVTQNDGRCDRSRETRDGGGKMDSMRIASGKVVRGRVELDAELPEGTSVTVIAPDDDGTFTADPATEQMLLESIAQCDQGRTVDINP
jgi:hypothetical protein